MNTERSKKKAADYLKNGNQSKRKTQTGNAMIDSIPEDDSEMKRAIDGLEYFLQTGELMSAKPLTE
jgi:hypothetical protein